MIESMASCGINFRLRCPSGVPCFSSRVPLVFINSIPSSTLLNLKKVTINIYKYILPGSRTLITYKELYCLKPYSSRTRRCRVLLLSAAPFIPSELTWLPRRNQSHKTECWSVLSTLKLSRFYVLFACFLNNQHLITI